MFSFWRNLNSLPQSMIALCCIFACCYRQQILVPLRSGDKMLCMILSPGDSLFHECRHIFDRGEALPNEAGSPIWVKSKYCDDTTFVSFVSESSLLRVLFQSETVRITRPFFVSNFVEPSCPFSQRTLTAKPSCLGGMFTGEPGSLFILQRKFFGKTLLKLKLRDKHGHDVIRQNEVCSPPGALAAAPLGSRLISS